jgi:hypothetical protein
MYNNMRHEDGRLTAKHYRATLEGVEIQFALIRFALKELPQNAIKRFFRIRLDHQLDALCKAQQIVGGDTKDDKQFYETMREFTKKQHRKNSKPADARFKIEFSEDRLNQSELLILVAHFESFMKEVHRRFLNAAPEKVFSKKQSEVTLRDVFQGSIGGHPSKFLREQVIKEVKFLDSQRVEYRAKYFSEHFGVSFGSQRDIDDLKEIMEARNKISHEIYFSPPRTVEQITLQPLVPEKMLKRAWQLFSDIPDRCIEAGAKVYQSYFRHV